MTVFLVTKSKVTMGKFIHSWLLILEAFMVVETSGGFSNLAKKGCKNLAKKKKNQEKNGLAKLDQNFSKPTSVYSCSDL